MNLSTVNIQKENKNFEKENLLTSYFTPTPFSRARTQPGEKFSITIFLVYIKEISNWYDSYEC